jgi:hypothetical protein
VQLAEPVQLASAGDAAGRGEDRFESDDSSGGTDELTERDGGVAVVGADIDPGFTGRHVVAEPVEEGFFRCAEDRAGVVVPGGVDGRAAERAGEDGVGAERCRQNSANTLFKRTTHGEDQRLLPSISGGPRSPYKSRATISFFRHTYSIL